jgi:hypothetical protein
VGAAYVLRRREHDHAHQVALNGLVGEVEEGLPAVTVEQDVQAHRTLGAGLLRGTGDARVGSELVRGPRDLESQVGATVILVLVIMGL